MFVLLNFVFIIIFQLLNIVFLGALISLVMPVDILNVVAVLSVLWLIYFVLSGLVIYYLYHVRIAKLDVSTSRILQNFSFANRVATLKCYFSDVSPLFMRLNLFDSSNIVINKAIFNELTKREIDAFLYLELEYSKSFASFVEVFLQRSYLIFWFPVYRLLTMFLDKTFVRYLLSPYTYFYKYVIMVCRGSMRYKGEFEDYILQISFKIKAMERNHCTIQLFGYSELCLGLMLEKGPTRSENRFEMDEVVR